MPSQPGQLQATTPPRAEVLMVGKRWDLVAPSIEALADGGEFAFRGPVEASEADTGANVFLVAPETDRGLGKPRRDREDGTAVPLLLCVSSQALQSGDNFDNVDDFVVVPCSAAELAKRITRLTTDSRLAATQETQRITVGDIAINTDTYEVTVSGMAIPLAWTEFQLLQFLMLNVGRVFHREDLLLHVWGADYIGGLRTVDVHIRRLRGKLGQSGERWLRTVRKVGYGLDRRPTLG